MSESRGVEDRLLRLEEGFGFAERTVEQLNEEVLGLNRRVAELASALRRMEERLRQLTEPPDDAESSGGPSDLSS